MKTSKKTYEDIDGAYESGAFHVIVDNPWDMYDGGKGGIGGFGGGGEDITEWINPNFAHAINYNPNTNVNPSVNLRSNNNVNGNTNNNANVNSLVNVVTDFIRNINPEGNSNTNIGTQNYDMQRNIDASIHQNHDNSRGNSNVNEDFSRHTTTHDNRVTNIETKPQIHVNPQVNVNLNLDPLVNAIANIHPNVNINVDALVNAIENIISNLNPNVDVQAVIDAMTEAIKANQNSDLNTIINELVSVINQFAPNIDALASAVSIQTDLLTASVEAIKGNTGAMSNLQAQIAAAVNAITNANAREGGIDPSLTDNITNQLQSLLVSITTLNESIKDGKTSVAGSSASIQSLVIQVNSFNAALAQNGVATTTLGNAINALNGTIKNFNFSGLKESFTGIVTSISNAIENALNTFSVDKSIYEGVNGIGAASLINPGQITVGGRQYNTGVPTTTQYTYPSTITAGGLQYPIDQPEEQQVTTSFNPLAKYSGFGNFGDIRSIWYSHGGYQPIGQPMDYMQQAKKVGFGDYELPSSPYGPPNLAGTPMNWLWDKSERYILDVPEDLYGPLAESIRSGYDPYESGMGLLKEEIGNVVVGESGKFLQQSALKRAGTTVGWIPKVAGHGLTAAMKWAGPVTNAAVMYEMMDSQRQLAKVRSIFNAIYI